MRQRTTAAAIGLIGASTLVVVVAATSLGGSPSPSHPPEAGVATATPSAIATGSATAVPIDSASPSDSAAPTSAPTATALPTSLLVPGPLTGLPVTPAVAARHPIAVMIDDLRAARPQSGLSKASVVWQAPAEGGIPRYMAIFQDTLPASLGPVRSSRLYFIAWAAEWRSVYGHAGGSPQAKATLASKGHGQYVYNADAFRYSGTFFRIRTRSAPHNLYTTGTKLRSLSTTLGAKDKTYTAAWHFAPDAPLASRPNGGTITIGYPYNTIRYTYDRASNRYLRSVTGEKKQTDAADGTRIAPKNVIVMRMAFGPLNDGHPGAPRLEANVVGHGVAWISTNGRTVKGTWKKTAFTAPTLFFDGSGNPVTLTAGQTFVQVVTTSTTGYPVSFKAGSN